MVAVLRSGGTVSFPPSPLVCPDHPAQFVLGVLLNALKAQTPRLHGGKRRAGVRGSAAAAGPAVTRLVLDAGPAVGYRRRVGSGSTRRSREPGWGSCPSRGSGVRNTHKLGQRISLRRRRDSLGVQAPHSRASLPICGVRFCCFKYTPWSLASPALPSSRVRLVGSRGSPGAGGGVVRGAGSARPHVCTGLSLARCPGSLWRTSPHRCGRTVSTPC